MSKLRKQIRRIYEIYQDENYLAAARMERQLKEERDAIIDTINKEYARMLVPLGSLVVYLERGETDKLYEFTEAFAPVILDEIDDAADELFYSGGDTDD